MISYTPREHSKAIKERRLRIQHEQQRSRSLLKVLLGVLVVVFTGCIVYICVRPAKPVIAKQITPTVSAKKVVISWPKDGEAAVGTSSGGVIATSGAQKKAPTASVAKTMTALMVLQKHPLKQGEQGPLVPITQADVELYNQYAANDGSVVQVTVGEQLTEYQALQALLLPSANNIADTLAIWAYGSLPSYHTAANQFARAVGMNNSTFASDASGFSPETTSTPRDLVLLGQLALKQTVLKEIVAQKTAVLPVEGEVKNVNYQLGVGGINGIKTGNTAEAGGCFLFSAERKIDGHTLTIVGAIMNAQNLEDAQNGSQELLNSVFAGFGTISIAAKSTVVGNYTTPWGETVAASTTQSLSVFGWRGATPAISVSLEPLYPSSMQSSTGKVTATTAVDKQSTTVVASPLKRPPLRWRLAHPF